MILNDLPYDEAAPIILAFHRNEGFTSFDGQHVIGLPANVDADKITAIVKVYEGRWSVRFGAPDGYKAYEVWLRDGRYIVLGMSGGGA